MERSALAFVGVAAAVVLVAGGVAAFYLPAQGVPPTAYGLGPSSSESGSVQGLVLGASLSASTVASGEAITLRIWESNPLSSPVNVSAAADWPSRGLSMGPCGSPDPFAFKVLTGQYDRSSPGLSSAQGIKLYQPGMYACPAEYDVGSYDFKPGSTNATLAGFCTPEPCFSERMNVTEAVAGEYLGGSDTLQPLPPGVYTVVAGDEWGASVLLYFDVYQAGARTVILPAGTGFAVSSSYDCVAGDHQVPFTVQSRSYLTGAFVARAPGVTLYVATEQQASAVSSGHPSQWVYSSGLTENGSFTVPLPPGSYVAWIEGADLGCGQGVVTPLEVETLVNMTQSLSLVPA